MPTPTTWHNNHSLSVLLVLAVDNDDSGVLQSTKMMMHKSISGCFCLPVLVELSRNFLLHSFLLPYIIRQIALPHDKDEEEGI